MLGHRLMGKVVQHTSFLPTPTILDSTIPVGLVLSTRYSLGTTIPITTGSHS